MSRVNYWKCNICGEKIEKVSDGYGLNFHSTRSGAFEIGYCNVTDGCHICKSCAKTLLKELSAIKED